MKEIPLTQGYLAIVDDEDYAMVSTIKWHYSHGYAKNKGVLGSIYMHRIIMGAENGWYVDHANGNKLDNRRANLRLCTQSQNLANSRVPSHNTSGFKGVSFNKTLGYWVAVLKVNQKNKVKYFKKKEDAIVGYKEMAVHHFGEFARIV